jgi:2-polyprenyl-6-methoxyphenol hydroxylase-like FAD-dependent oxidoreductase
VDWDSVVVGYGPGGAALSWLLASRGLRVLALERQVDFHRAFRGEVLLPSGLDALAMMGLGPALAATPQIRTRRALVHNGRVVCEFTVREGNRSRVVSPGGLLEAIAAQSRRCPGFALYRGSPCTDLILEGGRVMGVRARVQGGVREIRSRLVVGADGRGSAVARKAGIGRSALEQGYDVLWFKVDLSGLLGDRETSWREMRPGRMALAYPSPEGSYQVGVTLARGELPAATGRDPLAAVLPLVTPELGEAILAGRDALVGPMYLHVVCERAERWSVPGLLLLGDAAHPMSPVASQGINVALRDAIVAANRLVPALRGRDPAAIDAACVATERERLAEVVPVQQFQTRVGARLLNPSPLSLGLLPWLARLGWRPVSWGQEKRIRRGLQPVSLSV